MNIKTLFTKSDYFKNKISGIPDAWRWGFLYWTVSRILLCGWGALLWGIRLIQSSPSKSYYFDIHPILNGLAAPLLGIWLRWDTVNYVRIAQSGYYDNDLSAFFPLFPLLGRLTGWLIGGNYFAGLLIVSNLALLLGLVLFFKLVQESYSTQLAHRTLIVLLAFPGAFYFYGAYPHSLLFLFAVLTGWFAQQKKWLFCAVTGLLAGLTHSTASTLAVLIAAYALPIWWKNKTWKNIPPVLSAVTPFLGIALFLSWRINQGFPDFTSLQMKLWGKHLIAPWDIFTLSFTNITLEKYRTWLDLIIFLAAIFFIPIIWKRISKEYALFLASIVASLSIVACNSEPLPSLLRYILIGFPLFIGLAYSIKKRFNAFMLGCIIFQMLLSGGFFMWLWIA